MSKFEETEEAISLHGLGFLQIKLGGKQRLHVWHPDLPRRACFRDSAVHNHRFGFSSRVLVGVQINHNCRLVIGDPTHVAYKHEGPRSMYGNRPWIAGDQVCVAESGMNIVAAGEEYGMRPYDFHWTEPGGDGRVATLMTKLSEGDAGAHSLCKIGVQPDADFDRKQWPAERLWQVAFSVLAGSDVKFHVP